MMEDILSTITITNLAVQLACSRIQWKACSGFSPGSADVSPLNTQILNTYTRTHKYYVMDE